MSYRKLYFYKCDICDKKRQTFKPNPPKTCGKCKRTAIPENQRSIFDLLGDKGVGTVNK